MPDGSETLTAQLHPSIGEISAADWMTCAGVGNPFVSYAFLKALEDSGSVGENTGWIPRHVSLQDADGQLAAVMPMYIKLHSYGEYVFDWAWADAFQRAGGDYYPNLQVAVPFSPVPGPRLLAKPTSVLTFAEIAHALRQICLKINMSSAHITFCTEDEWKGLGTAGWLQRVGLQYHWHNRGYEKFDDFLAALSSSHRKSIKRERRDANAAGLVFETLRGSEIKPLHWDAFYRFYQNTIDKKWGSAYLTRDFFSLLSETLGDYVVLIMAFHEEIPVAAALNILGNDTLYGRNWGCVGQWPFLHFELCYYRAIDFAIEHKLKRVEAGAQGEHKMQRGYLPQPTYSAHYISHPGLARAVGTFVREERAAIEQEISLLSKTGPFKQLQT